MDEILATIRRIIADDEHPASAAGPSDAGARPATSAAAGEKNDDILELTQAVNEDGTIRHLAPIGGGLRGERVTPAPEPPGDGRIEPALPSEEAARVTTTVTAAAEPAPEPRSARSGEELMSEVASFAAAAAFAHIAAAPRGAPREMPRIGDRTLEDLVADLLRPLLKAWLDENLPPLVERLVQSEIARVVERSGAG